jgi:hypothetical protein
MTGESRALYEHHIRRLGGAAILGDVQDAANDGGVSARSALAARVPSLRADGDGAGRLFLLLVVFLRMRRVGGALVDAALGERRQLLVGRLLLVERLLQQLAASVWPIACAQAISVPYAAIS